MNIGVLGLGSIGLRHARNLLAMGHRVYGYDPSYDRRHLLIQAGGEEASEELAYSCPAVVIASPSDHHLAQLRRCLRDGKHVFVEKPIATELAPSTYEMLHNARERGLVVFVGNNLRMHGCVIKAKEWLDRIGTPLWAAFTCAQYNDKPAYLRDGTLSNWGAHELDLCLYLLGPAHVVRAYGCDTIVDVILKHDTGCQTNVHLDYVSKPEQRGFVIGGKDGSISADIPGRQVFLHDQKSTIHTDCAGSFDADYLAEMRAFLDRIDGQETLGATGNEGLATLELILQAKAQI